MYWINQTLYCYLTLLRRYKIKGEYHGNGCSKVGGVKLYTKKCIAYASFATVFPLPAAWRKGFRIE